MIDRHQMPDVPLTFCAHEPTMPDKCTVFATGTDDPCLYFYRIKLVVSIVCT